MKHVVLDLETNGLLDSASRIHSLVLRDVETGAVQSEVSTDLPRGFGALGRAETIVGHNVIGFDLPVIQKIFNLSFGAKVRDTLLMAQLRWPEIIAQDYANRYFIPKDLFGSHSLEAYGYRLGLHKGNFKGPWDKWSQEMQDYCIQDTAVTLKLYKELQKAIQEGIIPESAIEMEHEFAKLMHWQEQEGVPFDTEAAIKLRDPLKQRIEEVRDELIRIVPPTIIKLKTKTKTVPFNPGSRDQILKFLQDKYDWKPEKRTKNGNACLDEDVLKGLTYPEAPLFVEYFELQKLLGMLSEGKESWLNHVKDGRIHGKVTTAGTITGRCSHQHPNLGQIPSTRSFMGKEVRSLFYAPEGYSLVGIDASGLELRCLAHYLDHWDYGQYTQVVCEGDVHTTNMLAAGLQTRDQAKTFIYALLYGAGDEKIGSIVLPDGTKERKKDAGLVLRTRFMQQIPAFGALVKEAKKQVENKGYLVGIDGRRLTIRHLHAIINTLMQNAGAVACKNAWVILFEKLRAQGIKAKPALNVHDEAQILVPTEQASLVGKLGVASIEEAGIKLGFKCPLTGAYRIGRNWSETH